MTTRGLLFAGLASLAFIGVVASLLPFLRYGGAGHSPVIAVDIANLAPGQYRRLERGGDRLYVLRLAGERLVVLWVPLRDGAVVMPDRAWDGRGTRLCRDFGPAHRAGELIDGGTFACRDAAAAASQRWDASGQYSGDAADRLEAIPAPRYTRLNSALLVRLPRPVP